MALDNNGENVTLWNDAAESMFGWSEEEVLGRPIPFLTEDCREDSDRLWAELLEQGQLQGAELRRRRKDGTPIDLSLWATVLRDEQGHIVGTFGLLSDITERKRMEASLRLSEQAIRELYDITSGTTSTFDEQVRAVLDLGRRRFQLPIAILGTARGEDFELTAIQSDYPMAAEGTLLPLRDTYCSETLRVDEPIALEHIGASDWRHLPAYSLLRFESYLGTRLSVHGDAVGSISFLSPHPYPGTFTDSDKHFLQLIARWLSSELERRQAETALRESEERFRLIFEKAPVGMCIVTQDRTLRKINSAFQTMLGYSKDELLGSSCTQYTHPDDAPDNDALTDRSLRGEIPGYSTETRYLRNDGQWIWVTVTTSCLQLPGEPDRLLLAIVEEITDRKRAEQELSIVRERLQYLIASNPSIIYSCRISGDYGATYVSDNVVDHLGYEPHEFIDVPDFWASHVHPDDLPRVIGELPRLFRQGSHVNEYRFLHKDGTYRWMHDRLTLVHDATRNPVEIVGSWIDITDRKRAEEALRASEERFGKAFRSSPHPIIVTELETGRCIEVNDASLQLFGFHREEVIGQSTIALGLWQTPADRERLMNRLREEGSLRNLDLMFYTKDRTARRFVISCELIELNGTECVVTVGTDMTEQKRAEEALRRSELEVRQAFEERERLSQDLHDNLLQSLYAIGMGMEITRQRIKRISQTNAKRVEDSIGQLNAVIREVRGVIPRMHVSTVPPQTLADGLRSLVGSFVATGAGHIVLTIDPKAATRLTAEQSVHVIAIAKEALSNSIRHTRASNRSLTLDVHRGSIRLEVADNGAGFQLHKKEHLGMGIKNMRARAAKLNAALVIRTSLRKGTRITLSLRQPS
jgi:PAS domain S-box-containing protein